MEIIVRREESFWDEFPREFLKRGDVLAFEKCSKIKYQKNSTENKEKH